MKISKHLKITLAIAGGFFLYKVFFSKKEAEQTRPEETHLKFSGEKTPKPRVTTPVSGTSQTILEGLDKNDAEQLKEELKGK